MYYLNHIFANVDYTSFLQVVHFRSVRAAGYLLNAYSFGSCITGIVLGFIIKYTGRYKIWAVIGVPIYILGTGTPLLLELTDNRFNDPLPRPRIY
jgi:MFS family permease